ncbi:hypothetical protein Ancab_006464 [Ancistrocladus abbreviatus]
MTTMAASRLMLLFLVSCGGIHVVCSVTDPSDVAVLQSLENQWENTPPSGAKSGDPCGAPWDGVTCNNSRVTSLSAFSYVFMLFGPSDHIS